LLRVLIVEDEAIVATDLAETMKSFGHTVTDIASSAADTHQAIKNNRPDFILMDVRIKGVTDGIDLALEVFEHYNIPVVHLTAYSDDETISRIKKSQSFGYLSKPYNEKELYLTIELAVSKHKILNNSKSLFMLYSAALEQMNGPVIISDLEKRILLINSLARKMLEILPYDLNDYFVSNILEKKDTHYLLKTRGDLRNDILFDEIELIDSHGKKKGFMYISKC
jgi:CheY-like chemotaxis protein